MSQTRILFLAEADVLAFHEEQLRRFGGPLGILHPELLGSALAAPLAVHAYDPNADLYELAAAYAFHLTQAHAFADGNKRTAFLATLTFLTINGVEIPDTAGDIVADMILRIAAGNCDRRTAAEALRAALPA